MRFLRSEDIENLPKITSTKLVQQKTGKKDPEGIFSPYIFGSDEYSCKCGELKGAWNQGIVCEKCETTILNPDDNIYRNGRFEIPNGYKIFNPTIYTIIKKSVKKFETMINPQNKHVDINGHVIYNDEKEDVELINFIEFSLNYEEAVNKLFPDETENELKDFLLNNEDIVMMSSIPLLPLHLRPAELLDKRMTMDPINTHFISINTHVQSLASNVEVDDLYSIEKELFKIQQSYQELYSDILEIIEKSEGLARDQILSNRINFSGRSVITINHENNPNFIKIPRIMFLEIYFPQILVKLSNLMNLDPIETSEYYYWNRFDETNENINHVISEMLNENLMVLLNRNPSLHMQSIQAFYITDVTNDETIKIPKSCLQGFNADFDGDTMAIFTIHSNEGKEEAKKLMVKNNIISRKTFDLNSNIMLYQDDAMGLYLFDASNVKVCSENE